MSPKKEDPRVETPDICGVTFVGSTGIEWICIRRVHAKIYKRRTGKPHFSENPQADQHYMVPRYPYRKDNQ